MTDDKIRDQLAEQAWGVLVAAQRDGVTDLSVIAHSIAANVLPLVATELREAAEWIVFDETAEEIRADIQARAEKLHPAQRQATPSR